jgi:hypothetical protein
MLFEYKVQDYSSWTVPDWKDPDAEFDEVERTSIEKGINLQTLLDVLDNGSMVELNDNMWSNLENQDSWQIQEGQEGFQMAVDLANSYKRNWSYVVKGFKENHTMPAPIIIKLPDQTCYQISGNTRLMFAKALGIRPKVWLGEIKDDLKPSFNNIIKG